MYPTKHIINQNKKKNKTAKIIEALVISSEVRVFINLNETQLRFIS